MKTIVLLSGGLDSTVALAEAVRDGHEVIALSFDYGQRHRAELEYARVQAARRNVAHEVVALDFSFARSALLNSGELERGRAISDMRTVPRSYVPGRNTLMLAHALARAEVHRASQIMIGANAADLRGFPDCRPAFLEAFERLANLATGSQHGYIRVFSPLIHMSKAEVIAHGFGLAVDFEHTSTCYDPAPAGACGVCDACTVRLAAFAEVAARDPVAYR
jgi:7-cyano-7-deazaguanine synthase